MSGTNVNAGTIPKRNLAVVLIRFVLIFVTWYITVTSTDAKSLFVNLFVLSLSLAFDMSRVFNEDSAKKWFVWVSIAIYAIFLVLAFLVLIGAFPIQGSNVMLMAGTFLAGHGVGLPIVVVGFLSILLPATCWIEVGLDK